MEINQEIKYHYPHDASDSPFWVGGNRHYFMDANGFTCLGDFKDFDLSQNGVFEKLLAAIPMGYKTLLLCERLLIFENGMKVWENNQSKKKGKEVRYRIYQKALGDARQAKQESGYAVLNAYHQKKLHSYEWMDIRKAKERAERISKDGKAVLVCRVISNTNWH